MKTCPKCYSACHDHERLCGVCGALLTTNGTPEQDPFVGKVIAGNFLLKRHVGGGAMGSIYLAEQISLGKTVCIKLLHEHLLGDSSLAHRFEREARAASRLKHPNCIQIIDFGQTRDGLLYMAMEYIAGKDLGDILYREFPLEPSRIIHILEQVTSALDEAHAMGIIHRDLKPENIMLEDRRLEKDFVKVLDFGIAKITDRETTEADSFQTMTGVVCGTPEYMSPEQARGEKLDARSDLYALGVLLYQLLTNELPFGGDTAVEIVTKHLREDPVPPRLLRPAVPRELEELALALMAKDRELRPPSALTVRDELEKIGQMLSDAETRRGYDSERTIPGMAFSEAFSQYGGGGDRTLVTMPPDFEAMERLLAGDTGKGDVPAATNAAAAADHAPRSAGGSTVQTRATRPNSERAKPREDVATVRRGVPPVATFGPDDTIPDGAGSPVDVPRVRARGRGPAGQDFIDTVPERSVSGGGSRWALVALGLVGAAVIVYLGYLFLVASTGESGGTAPEPASAADVVSAGVDDVVAAVPTAVRPATGTGPGLVVVPDEGRGGTDTRRVAVPAVAGPGTAAMVSREADAGGQAESGAAAADVAEPGATAGGADSGTRGAMGSAEGAPEDAAEAAGDAGPSAAGAANDGVREAPVPPSGRRARREAHEARGARKEEAHRLETEADAARARGDYGAAIDLYKKSHRLDHRPLLLKKLGQCYNARNDFSSGSRYLRQYLKTLPEGDPRRELITRQIRD